MEGIGRNLGLSGHLGPYIPHTTLFFSGTSRGNLFLSRNLVLDANGSSVVIFSPLAARIPSVTASVLKLFTHKDLFFFSKAMPTRFEALEVFSQRVSAFMYVKSNSTFCAGPKY